MERAYLALAASKLPDFRDQVRRVDRGNGDDAVYHYDANGQRVRKVVRNGANVEQTVYLGGYETTRKSVGGVLREERTTLHVMDDQQRIALVETKTVSNGAPVADPAPRVRYQLGNHLGSAVLEVDEAGAIISYEEYHPYGTTAWHAPELGVEVSRKRYRYTGLERDEDTGLYVVGPREYAPWLARWCSVDPDQDRPLTLTSPYVYASNGPGRFVDSTGESPEEALARMARLRQLQLEQLTATRGAIQQVSAPGQAALRAARVVEQIDQEILKTQRLSSRLRQMAGQGAGLAGVARSTVLGMAVTSAMTGPAAFLQPTTENDYLRGLEHQKPGEVWDPVTRQYLPKELLDVPLMDLSPQFELPFDRPSRLEPEFGERTQRIRERIGGRFARGEGNIGYAVGVIDGLTFELEANSSAVQGNGTVPTVPESERTLTTHATRGARPTANDTEVKLLEYLIYEGDLNVETEGQIILYTELPPCDSCGGRSGLLGVIEQFQDLYPHIDLTVLYGEGQTYVRPNPP